MLCAYINDPRMSPIPAPIVILTVFFPRVTWSLLSWHFQRSRLTKSSGGVARSSAKVRVGDHVPLGPERQSRLISPSQLNFDVRVLHPSATSIHPVRWSDW